MARHPMLRLGLALLSALALAATALAAPPATPAPVALVPGPVPGMVTLVDLGAVYCPPCQVMAPLLRELEREYRGRAAVVVIDVLEHQDQVARFGVRLLPTQIFYDKTGREVSRHEGFLDKRKMAETLDRLLAK